MNSESRPNKFFYGWIFVAVSTLALLIGNGLSIGGIPVFYKFVQTDLVNSGAVAPDKIQSVYGLAPALTFLLAGFFAPVERNFGLESMRYFFFHDSQNAETRGGFRRIRA